MPRSIVALAALLLVACTPSDELLVVITVDTLRWDHVGVYGTDGADALGGAETPHLDALASRSTRFDAAYAPTAFTLPSIGAVMTGLFPEQAGLLGNLQELSAEIPTLSTLLGERGWRTGAVVSNYILRSASGLGRGFEIYDDEMLQAEAVRGWPERTAEHTTDDALEALDRLWDPEHKRVFLWVHYQDPHGPYTPPDGLRERYLERERSRADGRERLEALADNRGQGGIPAYQLLAGEREVAFYRAGYAGEVHYTDREIGRLLAGLRERDLFDRAVIVVVADHGEGLGENDYWFAHGEHLTDDQVRVPLLIRFPGQAGSVRRDVVGLVDLLPTLAARLELGAPPPGPGRDLFAEGASSETTVTPLLGASPALRVGLVQRDRKLVLTPAAGGMVAELFDRGRETAGNRATAEPEATRRLQARLFGLRNAMQHRPAQPQTGLTEKDYDRLRALGYGDD